jgi:hypothetical protein
LATHPRAGDEFAIPTGLGKGARLLTPENTGVSPVGARSKTSSERRSDDGKLICRGSCQLPGLNGWRRAVGAQVCDTTACVSPRPEREADSFPYRRHSVPSAQRAACAPWIKSPWTRGCVHVNV